MDLLKNYEPEQCSCKIPKNEDEEACGSGCINRSTYNECDVEVCKNGAACTNMAIQRRQYAPGLERFMTAKKGWGVRARQSISKGSFILEYTGEVCSSKVFEQRMLSRYTTDNHHYCLAIDNKMMIDAHRAGSAALWPAMPLELPLPTHATTPDGHGSALSVATTARL